MPPWRPSDPRPGHPLTPTSKTVIDTDALRGAITAGDEISVTVVPVILGTTRHVGRREAVVELDHVRRRNLRASLLNGRRPHRSWPAERELGQGGANGRVGREVCVDDRRLVRLVRVMLMTAPLLTLRPSCTKLPALISQVLSILSLEY